MVLTKGKNLKKVQVLLATFNGSRYLAPLMDSLIDQDYQNTEIIVRDDGSNDNTIEILRRYLVRENISIVEGENVGVPESFFRLLQLSSSDSDFFAFSDQDDVWKKDKISRAINILEKLPLELPSMYCSRVLIVDEMLNLIEYSRTPKRGLSFENAIIENIATGCTIVMNNAARDLLLKEFPKNAIMHDWWTYLVISAFGRVVYDMEPRILYRQHSSNVVGSKIGFINRWKARIYRFLRFSRVRLPTKQAMEFNRIYGPILSQEKKLKLNRFIEGRDSFMGRIHYAFFGEAYRQSKIDNLILKILIIFNRV